ncbi:MAG: hypothetical protein HOP14_15485 [Acidobacteria bacterium]|nr:hypothetical protein [Acidobacteriota bacterium]
MADLAFGDAQRVNTGLLARMERRTLMWLAGRLPAWVTSDHLTALAAIAMAAAGLCYWQAAASRLLLLGAVAALALNWFGDSLDGTLARVRQQQRPRYGFYVDHLVDCFGAVFLLAGLGASGFMHPFIAMGVLVAYLLISIELYLATYTLTVFRMSHFGVGPTELRILLAIGTLALFRDPRVAVLGTEYRLFDVGGVVAILGVGCALLCAVARNTRSLYLAEPLPLRGPR